MRFNDVIERLKDILSLEVGERAVLDKDVAQALELDHTKLSKLRAQDKLPYEAVSLFCARRKISINWVLFGQAPRMLEEETEKYAKVRYLSGVRAGCGGGGFGDVESSYILVPQAELLRLGLKADRLEAVAYSGDSMPSFGDMGIAFIDRTQKPTNGSICLIGSGEGVQIKRVYAEGLNVRLESENKHYSDMYISDEEILTAVCVAVGSV